MHQQIACGGALQVTPSEIKVNGEQAVIRTYAVAREPDLWSLHAMGELIGDTLRDSLQIPCPFVIHYGVHIPAQEKTARRCCPSWL